MLSYKLISKFKNFSYFIKRFNGSALFVSGEKAQDTFAVLTPHIDFESCDLSKIERSVELRGLNIDINKVIHQWIFYKKYQHQKLGLEEAKMNISQKIKSLNSVTDKEEIEKLIAHAKMIKNDLRIVKDYFYPVEETACIKVLSLPNILHPSTPTENKLIHSFGQITKKQSENHVDIAKDLIEFKSNFYYLKNDAALFEIASTSYFSEKLLEKNFIKFSNSDFIRSIIAEGCGIDFTDPKQIFTLMETDDTFHENSRLHLTGGASFASFMAYHAKNTIFPTLLPLRYFTIGRQYIPNNNKQNSLLNVPQETAVEIFIATKDDSNEMEKEFSDVLKSIQEIYDSFGYHYQILYLPPKCLQKYECLRASIQMYSPFLQSYVEVGYLSLSDNYVSKRLLFNYGKGSDISFPKIISGTIFSVPKSLACIIENGNNLLINDFKKYFT